VVMIEASRLILVYIVGMSAGEGEPGVRLDPGDEGESQHSHLARQSASAKTRIATEPFGLNSRVLGTRYILQRCMPRRAIMPISRTGPIN
jgi:hypothetical protein